MGLARVVEGQGARLWVRREAKGAAAEQFRVMARRLEARIAAGAKRIALTSATTGEGRSTAAANVALALGANGRRRVVLVDANPRSPSVARMFSKLATLGGRPGLAEVVRGEASLEEAIVKLPGNDDVWLLGAGDAREPHAIFESPRLAEITQALATRFDAVILDGPPALPTADLPGLASAIDALVLVVRARKTPRELVMRALDVIEATGVTVAGAVLNGVEAGAGPVFELQAEHDRATRKPAAEVATIGARAAEVARS